MSGYRSYSRSQGQMSALKIRLLIAAAIIVFSLIGYMSNRDINPITGKPQRVGGITAEYETALGMQSVRVMAEQYGGFSRDAVAVNEVESMGNNIVEALEQDLSASNRSQPYHFQFHLLDDDQVVNAFALPGGQIFITEALYRQLDHPGQLAAVLGHEIGHVIERHSSQQMAQNQMFGDLARAVGVASGDISGQQMAGIVAGLVGMKYSRTHELESDRWGVKLMSLLGYHPKHMFELMDILERSAGSGGGLPEFASTHPTPENRREYINLVIAEVFPYGVPDNLR